MNARKRFLVIAITVGAVGVGVAAVGVPAVAGLGPFAGPTNSAAGPGPGPGPGLGGEASAGANTMGGNGAGPNGAGMCGGGGGVQARDGSCLDGSGLPAQGELTAQQQATLAVMAQQEKLTHDLYAAFAGQYDAMIFERISSAETQHLTIMRTLLTRYGLTDPTAGRADGQFADPSVQATYDRLVSQGRTDLAAALQVGTTVEQTRIDELRAALDGLTAPDVMQVYENLLQASQNHLAAFDRWS